MKKIILLFTTAIFIAFSQVINAQAPNSFDFQSLVRDASGKFLKSQSVGVRISILHGSVSGTAVYTETHTVSTNTNGLLTLTVGKGVTSDNFSSINWSAGPYFIKTEMDLSGGTDYSLSTITQMMSVPYALYANSAGDYEARLAALEARADAAEAAMASVPTYHADGFSIEPHRQVQFAKGNLTYDYTNKKYAFAAHQYTFSTSTTAIAGQTGLTYVFCPVDKSGRTPQTPGTKTLRFDDESCTSYDIAYYAKGNIGTGWFTPTLQHWDYLFRMRPNAAKLYSKATVNGVKGLVVLPDGWQLPAGSAFKPAQSSWTTNTYTTAQWTNMENAGAVFLPYDDTNSNTKLYSCYRCSSFMHNIGSSSPILDLYSFNISTLDYSIRGNTLSATYYYVQVRLVKDY